MESVFGNAAHLCISMRTAIFGARAGQRWLFRVNRGWLGGHRLTDRSVLWISCAFMLMGLALLAHDPTGRLRDASPSQWPSVSGTMVSMHVEERHSAWGVEWVPHVTYHYAVAGREYQNTRLADLRSVRWNSREAVNRFLTRYAGRETVLVYYNPRDVTQAMLEPELSGPDIAVGVGLLLVVLGMCTLAIYARVH